MVTRDAQKISDFDSDDHITGENIKQCLRMFSARYYANICSYGKRNIEQN